MSWRGTRCEVLGLGTLPRAQRRPVHLETETNERKDRMKTEAPAQRGRPPYWAFSWAVWAIWCATWATLAVVIYAYNFTRGHPSDPVLFWTIVPLMYLVAYGSWRVSRHLSRKR